MSLFCGALVLAHTGDPRRQSECVPPKALATGKKRIKTDLFV